MINSDGIKISPQHAAIESLLVIYRKPGIHKNDYYQHSFLILGAWRHDKFWSVKFVSLNSLNVHDNDRMQIQFRTKQRLTTVIYNRYLKQKVNVFPRVFFTHGC